MSRCWKTTFAIRSGSELGDHVTYITGGKLLSSLESQPNILQPHQNSRHKNLIGPMQTWHYVVAKDCQKMPEPSGPNIGMLIT